MNYEGTITNSYSTGSVCGDYHVGGLVGWNCDTTITNSYSTGGVSGNVYVGGLVGCNHYGTIIDSYSTGSINGGDKVGGLAGYSVFGTITNSYSTGSVCGDYRVGGLIGDRDYGTITNSYWDIETSGQSSSAGGTGKTTAEMKQQATFVGWDFANIWAIIEDVTYPFLQWQGSSARIRITHHYGDTSDYNGVPMFNLIEAVSEGTSPLDLLQSVADVTMHEGRVYSINGITESPPVYWYLYINGIPAPDEDIDSYQLRDGEVVHWDYSSMINAGEGEGASGYYSAMNHPEPSTSDIVKLIPEGSTPLDVLQSVADVTMREGRIYSIDGLAESPPYYWHIYINDIQVPDEDIDSYQLRDSEVIHCEYSNMNNPGE